MKTKKWKVILTFKDNTKFMPKYNEKELNEFFKNILEDYGFTDCLVKVIKK